MRIVSGLVAIALCVVAAIVLKNAIGKHTFAELRASVRAIPGIRLLVAVLLTAASYTVLTGYDALALHTVGIKLPYRKTIVASFLGYVFSHNVGLSVLGGSAARFRMYSPSGLTATDVVKVFAFCALTFWLGLLALGGAVLIAAPELYTRHMPLAPWLLRSIGVVLVAAPAAYVVACRMRRSPLRMRKVEFPLPRPSLAFLQIGLSVVDWAVAGSVLFALLPSTPEVSFFRFLGVFVAAQLVAVTSHVPGGLGVFEGSVLFLLRDHVSEASILGALLAYRAIYYLAPLAIGIVLLAAHEISQHGHVARRLANTLGAAFDEVSPRVVPRLLAFAAFWSGAVLLYSSATPPHPERLDWLARALPLPCLELAHFLGALAGVALLVVARGLHERLRDAWNTSIVLLSVGIAASLMKGLEWEEAALLALALAGLVPCRNHFTRGASLFRGPPAHGWTAAVAAVVVASAALALTSYSHIAYSRALWWDFSLGGDASRALRSTAGAAVIALAYGLSRLLKPPQPEQLPPTADQLEHARRLARASPDPQANLVLFGDKSLLWSADGDGFIMYAVQGSSWIALGDPIGAPDEARGLVRRFHAQAHHHGGRALFHRVLGDRLALYQSFGFQAIELGEEARVELARFTLDAPDAPKDSKGGAALRQAAARAESAGARFELVPASGVAPLLDDLARVSADWLAQQGGHEKGFAVGWFSREHLVHFPVALVRAGGRVVAFASVLLHEAAAAPADPGAPPVSNEELAIDVLRIAREAPAGTLELLHLRLLELARDRGFCFFNLGMAPLPFGHAAPPPGARESRREAWKRALEPVWRPRYLVVPDGSSLPSVMKDLVALINRGGRAR